MSKIRIRKRGNTYSYSFDISKNPRRMTEVCHLPRRTHHREPYDGNQHPAKCAAQSGDAHHHHAGTVRRHPRKQHILPAAQNTLSHRPQNQRSTRAYTWDDIDLETGAVSISRQRIQAGYFDTQKTKTSARTFYADALLLSYLRALKKEQTKDELRFGQAYQIAYESKDADRVFILLPKRLYPAIPAERRPLLCVHPTGIPYAHENVRYALYRLGLNSHSFRHTHATRLIESGAKPVDVAARLGHADATITQNLYAHDTDDMQQETARIFERFVDNGCM